MPELVLLAALGVAFVNGANDNMKGVATLYGSGVLSYRRALALATASTAAGGLASVALASGLVASFSGKGLVPDAALGPALLGAVALAAAGTVLLATRMGLPVSTTHALVGGLAGAGWVAAGPDLELSVLGGAFAAPLLAGPLLGTALAWSGLRLGRRVTRRLGVTERSCLCLEAAPTPAAAGVGAALLTARGAGVAGLPQRVALKLGETASCPVHADGSVAGLSARATLVAAHLFSGSLVGFARGLNDTPKILGLLVGASILAPLPGALAVSLVMAAGGLLAARRVAETLARRITPMTPSQGLSANLATSLLVIGASHLALPISTTHVATGGIFGIGAAGSQLQRGAVGAILGAWLITLPLAAGLGAGIMWGLR
jgi:PiT family inorganic phosphate transporter